jgi:hypothetical protein
VKVYLYWFWCSVLTIQYPFDNAGGASAPSNLHFACSVVKSSYRHERRRDPPHRLVRACVRAAAPLKRACSTALGSSPLLCPAPSHVEPVAPSGPGTRTRRRARRSFTTKRKAKRRGTCPPVRCRVFWQRRGTGVFSVSRPFLLQPTPPPANDADASTSVNGLPAGWTEHKDAATGKCYYYNASTVRDVHERVLRVSLCVCPPVL